MSSKSDDDESVARRVMMESPKIDRAMKNYVSILMARERSSERAKSLSTMSILKAARLILARIKLTNLVSPIEYGNLCPQRKEQTAVERLDEISNYKIMFALWQKVATSSKANPNHLFGRSYLDFLMKNPVLKFKQIVLNDAKEKFDGDDEKLEFFAEFFRGFAEDAGKVLGEYSELVWTENFESDLRRIQDKRKKQRQEDTAKCLIEEITE